MRLCAWLLISLLTSACARQQASERLTVATLQTFLQTLGYSPEPGPQSGLPYLIPPGVSGAPLPIAVTLSPGDDEVLVFSSLPDVGDASRIPPDVSLALLSENDSTGPVHFSFDAESNRFTLSLAFTNGGVTPAHFRNQLAYFIETLNRTARIWDPLKWQTPPTTKEHAGAVHQPA